MSLQRAYHHLSEEKRAAIMALAREGFSGAHIARSCGISEATVSREFSRQFPQGIPLKERRKRYEASAAHTRYRENRKKSKPRGKLLPQVIKTAEKLIRKGYSPEQMANTVLKGQASTISIYRWLYAGFLLYGDRSLLRHKGRRRVQRKEGKAKNTRQEDLCIPVLTASKAAVNSAISRWTRSNPDVTAPAACLL